MWKWFVYAYYRPSEPFPFYVGKGSGRRHLEHLARFRSGRLKYNYFFRSSLEKLSAQGQSPHICQLAYFKDEQSAYDYERELISTLGRRIDGSGLLDNIDPGFRNRTAWIGRRHSEQTRAAMRGRQVSEQTRQRQSKPKSAAHREKIRVRCAVAHNSTCRWFLKTPQGDIIVVENLNRFCSERALAATPIYRSLSTGQPVQRGQSMGWQALSKEKNIFYI